MQTKNPLIHQPWFWDAQIGALLVVLPLLASWLLSTGGSILVRVAGALLACGSLIIAYGSFLEPLRLSLNKKLIRILSLPDITIAVAADMHVGPYKHTADMQRLARAINALQPDLIVLPGDFLFDHHADCASLEPLSALRAPLGVFAVMGNHDTGDHVSIPGRRYKVPDRSAEVTAYLQGMGITVLRDSWQEISTGNGEAVVIAGVDGPWADMMDLKKTLTGIPEHLPVILLAHNPDVVLRKLSRRADLIISGHTHGGQIRLPFMGALHIPAETGKKYDQGIFRINATTTLAVTHGCGETLARARLLCPPEILLLQNKH